MQFSHTTRILIPIIVFFTVSCNFAFAGKTPNEDIVFENGFRAILIENHGVPMIGSSVIVLAGSAHEDVSNNGVSHMLEHLLFNGTATRTQEALYAEQAQFGIYNNAHTSQTYTNYIVLAARDHFETAIDIQSDMLFHSVIPPEKFEKEKGIVLNEIAKDQASPRYWATEQFNRTFFQGTPYNLPVLGTPTSIREMTRKQVLDYYQTRYIPNNMTAVIVGDFKRNHMIALLRKYFAVQPPGLIPTHYRHALDTTVFGTQVTSQMAIPFPYLTIGFPAPSINNPDYVPMSIATHLAQRHVKRLLDQDLIRMGKKPVQDIRVDYASNRDVGVVRVTSTLHDGEDPTAVIRSLRTVLPQTIVAERDDDTITSLTTELKVQDLSLLERPHYYGMMKANAIANAGWQFARSYSDRIATVTPSDITDVATRILATPQYVTSIIAPALQTLDQPVPDIPSQYYTRTIPNTQYSASSVARIETWTSQDLGPLIRKETANVIWAPSASGIPAGTNTRRIRLNNGLTVHINSNADSTIFAMHVLAKYRAWMEPSGKEGIADLLHTLLEYGTETQRREALERELSRIGATLKTRDSDTIPFDDYYRSRLYSYIRLSTIDEFADRAIRLLAQLVGHPRFHRADLDNAKQQAISRIAARDSNPAQRAESRLYHALFENDARAHPIEGTKASIESVTLEDLTTFHAQYFSPHNLVLSVSTGLPHTTIATLIANAFEPLPATAVSNSPLTIDTPLRHQGKTIREALGTSQSYIRLGAAFRMNPVDRPALTVMNALLSNHLNFELRERQGLAYLVGSDIAFMGTQALLDIHMGTTPETLDRAADTMKNVIRRITNIDTRPRNIQRIVNARNARTLMRQLTRINQAYRSGLDAFLRVHPGWTSPSPEELTQVTSKAVTRVRDTYLRDLTFVEVMIE